jgi:CRP-like cAMP-binding protein
MPPEPTAAEIYGRDFPPGAVVFEEGDPASRMYVIVSGEVRIQKRVGERDVTLALLGPGEAFGEMALLERAPRSAAAVVQRAARLLEIDEAAFADLVRNNGEVALRLLRRLSARLRDANRQIRNFLSVDAVSRAVEVLRAVAGPPGEDGFRPVPADAGPARLASRVPTLHPGPELWDRLRRARLVREVGGAVALAPAEVVDAYLRYAELRARFQALTAGELAEVSGLGGEPAALRAGALPAAALPSTGSGQALALDPLSPTELLRARLAPEGTVRDAAELRDLLEFVDLQRRFEAQES